VPLAGLALGPQKGYNPVAVMNRYILFILLFLLLVSGSACRRSTFTQAQVQAAGNAIRQLDRVRVAVSVKAPRNEYDLVLDTSSRAVKGLLPNIPDGPLKQEISLTLAAYQEAGQVWARQDTPDAAWQSAEGHLNKAKELLTQENRIF
jgi:hypothetical protein